MKNKENDLQSGAEQAALIDYYRNLYDRTPAMLHSIDEKGYLVAVSDQWLDTLGYMREEVIGRRSTEFLTAKSQQLAREILPEFYEKRAIYDVPYQFLRKDGSIVEIELSGISELNEDGQFIRSLAVLVDVTERKRARKALRELTVRLAEVQEDERRSIARELHDRVGQCLTALNINLQIMRGSISADREDDLRRLDDMQALVDQTAGHVRDVMKELRPAILDEYGLGATINWLAQDFSDRYHIPTQIENGKSVGRLPVEVENAGFRILQEGLNNIIKHAKASRVSIRITDQPETLTIYLEDDGVGVTQRRPDGWGMRIMEERAAAVGGAVAWQTRKPQGTIVEIDLPKVKT